MGMTETEIHEMLTFLGTSGTSDPELDAIMRHTADAWGRGERSLLVLAVVAYARTSWARIVAGVGERAGRAALASVRSRGPIRVEAATVTRPEDPGSPL